MYSREILFCAETYKTDVILLIFDIDSPKFPTTKLRFHTIIIITFSDWIMIQIENDHTEQIIFEEEK